MVPVPIVKVVKLPTFPITAPLALISWNDAVQLAVIWPLIVMVSVQSIPKVTLFDK